MILEAWKFDREPIENQLELEAPDLWLTFERIDVTERPDSELMDDNAAKISENNGWWSIVLFVFADPPNINLFFYLEKLDLVFNEACLPEDIE